MNRLGLSISALFVMALLMYMPVWMAEDEKPAQSMSDSALRPAYKAKNLTTTPHQPSPLITVENQ